MTITRLSRATALCLALSAPAFAQDVRALAEEYVRMPEVQQMISDMFTPESMAAQFKLGLPPGMTITDDQSQKIGVLMSEVMTGFRPRMEQLMIDGSAKYFTADELQALIDFYRSEHGASVMSKMQPYMQEVMGAMMPQMMGEMQKVGPEIQAILSTP
jgi:hypothetical protein